jgi:hypothetical protein
MSENPRYIGVGFPGFSTRNVSTATTKKIAPKIGKSVDDANFVPIPEIQVEAPAQPPVEAINMELPLDVNEGDLIEYVAEENAVDDEDNDEENAAVAHEMSDSSDNSNSDPESGSESESGTEPLGWSNTELKEKRNENDIGRPSPNSLEQINQYLDYKNLRRSVKPKTLKIEISTNPNLSGRFFRSGNREECYMSFNINNSILEITHFYCPGGGKELMYDAILFLVSNKQIFNENFFGLVELEAAPWIYTPKQKNKKKQLKIIKKSQKSLNKNYLSFGFKYIDATSNIFSATVIDLLSTLKNFKRRGGQTKKRQKRQKRQTKKRKQTKEKRYKKSITKKDLKKKTRKKR